MSTGKTSRVFFLPIPSMRIFPFNCLRFSFVFRRSHDNKSAKFIRLSVGRNAGIRQSESSWAVEHYRRVRATTTIDGIKRLWRLISRPIWSSPPRGIAAEPARKQSIFEFFRAALKCKWPAAFELPTVDPIWAVQCRPRHKLWASSPQHPFGRIRLYVNARPVCTEFVVS